WTQCTPHLCMFIFFALSSTPSLVLHLIYATGAPTMFAQLPMEVPSDGRDSLESVWPVEVETAQQGGEVTVVQLQFTAQNIKASVRAPTR
ncbi:hypothetical protein VIGAN_04330800, partial [Vigna angularis var. angularis]